MSDAARCVPRRRDDPLDLELVRRLDAWAEDERSECRQSLRPVLLELAAWGLAAVTLALAAITWLV